MFIIKCPECERTGDERAFDMILFSGWCQCPDCGHEFFLGDEHGEESEKKSDVRGDVPAVVGAVSSGLASGA